MGRAASSRLHVALGLAAGTVAAAAGVAHASGWLTGVDPGSSAQSQAQTTPAAPVGVNATCTAPSTSKNITVSWSAVAHATGYVVYKSSTSQSTGYSVAASVTTTSYVFTGSTGSNYWFEVTAQIGTNWVSVMSTASPESTINNRSPYCVQP